MDIAVFKMLHDRGLIDEGTLRKISDEHASMPLSVRWELQAMLSVGILLFTSGIGILIYRNIDSIGHITIIAAIAVLSAVCFVYSSRNVLPYSHQKVPAANFWSDYILILGCLLMISLVGYVQYQYHVFGTEWGLATFVPTVVLFFIAYRFDHIGVLSLAITGLGAWLGITLSPRTLLHGNAFSDSGVITSEVLLGVLFIVVSVFSVQRDTKAHFALTYKNFGTHLLFVSLIAGMIVFSNWNMLWLLMLLAVAAWQYVDAMRSRSFYFLTAGALYTYIGVGYMVVRLMDRGIGYEAAGYLTTMYFMGTGVCLAVFLIRCNQKFKSNDGL